MSIKIGGTDVSLVREFFYDAVKKMSDKLNHYNKQVEHDINASDFASSEASYIFFGPPVMSSSMRKIRSSADKQLTADAGNVEETNNLTFLDLLCPVGIVQQFSVQSSKQSMLIPELGSALDRRGPGKRSYSAVMSRVVTSHSNIQYSAYKWLRRLMETQPNKVLQLLRAPAANGSTQFMGFESNLYDLGFGCLELKGTSSGDFISAQYLEKADFNNLGNTLQAGNPIIIDNVSLSTVRVVPLMDESGNSLIKLKNNSIVSGSGFSDLVEYWDFEMPDADELYETAGASGGPTATGSGLGGGAAAGGAAGAAG